MRLRPAYQLPPDKQEKLERAIRLEWITIGFLLSIVAVMYLVMGNSQAMKAAWYEDLLSLIPPLAFLVSVKVQRKAPTSNFPYGYRRAMTVAFVVAAVTLCAMGLYILYDSLSSLLRQEHPTIGSIVLFGHQFWLGWLMMAALFYSMIPPVILGRMKLPLSKELHAKVLYADADMNKADWMTGLAGIAGVAGIGMGWWWADSVAAAFIAFDISRDGYRHLSDAVGDLLDQQPTTVEEQDQTKVRKELEAALNDLDWVREASLRLREEGDVFTGEAFIEVWEEDLDGPGLMQKLSETTRMANDFSWQIHDVVVVPVRSTQTESAQDEE